MEEEEIWLPLPEYEGFYEVSNLGRVKGLEIYIKGRNCCKRKKKEKLFKIKAKRSGYFYISLYKNENPIKINIHRIVAKTFIPNPENKPYVNHIDGNKENNRADNLEWCTARENTSHSYKCGLQKGMRGEQNPDSKLTEKQVLVIRRLYRINPKFNKSIVARKLGVHPATIHSIVNNKTWRINN